MFLRWQLLALSGLGVAVMGRPLLRELRSYDQHELWLVNTSLSSLDGLEEYAVPEAQPGVLLGHLGQPAG